MIRTTRLSAVALAGLCALFVAGCGPADTPAPAKPAQPAPGSSSAPNGATAQPSTGSGSKGDSLGGSGTLTLSGGPGGVYHFNDVACLGAKSPSGKLTMTAATANTDDATAIIGFDGAGKFTVAVTVGGTDLWTGEGTVGATGSRTVDTVKFTDVPVSSMGGSDAKVTGTLTCSGTQALF